MKKTYSIQIWFLHEDLATSAAFQTNKTLETSIRGCVQGILSAIFYSKGIRSQKFYNYYFHKDRLSQSIDEFFPSWPFKAKPSYSLYSTKTSKWVRACKEHLDLTKTYLDILLDEYELRFRKQHKLHEFLNWLAFSDFDLKPANLKTIVFPWKVLNPKYRNKDICLGYRKALLGTLTRAYIFDEFKDSKRDIPDFIVDHFKLDLENQLNF